MKTCPGSEAECFALPRQALIFVSGERVAACQAGPPIAGSATVHQPRLIGLNEIR